MRRFIIPALVAAYLGAIVLANLLLATLGPAIAPLNAFFLIGLDLTTRDRLHSAWSGRALWPRMLALIAAGGLLSYALSWLTPAPPHVVGRIALASCVAFLAAGIADALTYQRLSSRGWLARSNGSNVAGAVVDSFAFGLLVALPLPVIALQILAKIGGGALWAYLLRPRPRPARPAPPV